jgi:dihydroorotate dehydrogenase (fumarate)
MTNLATRYLGLDLASPIVASAGPLTGDPSAVLALVRAGAGAIVMPSLFEEEILDEELNFNWALESGADQFSEALSYFPNVPELSTPGDRYLARLAEIKALVDVPVIASLNADSSGGWVRYAGLLADAGADALELNLYAIAANPDIEAADVERSMLDIVSAVRAAVAVPLAVKLSPYYSAMANFARRVANAGADGLVLFNRFYQPDIDLEQLEVVPRVELSSPWELRLPLRWIAILRPLLSSATSLAATSGVHTGLDVVKAIAVGADVATMTSALLRHGPAHIGEAEAELRQWLDDHEYTSVGQLRGSMNSANIDDPSRFERSNYVKLLHSWAGSPAVR